jgi:hypothetical protein
MITALKQIHAWTTTAMPVAELIQLRVFKFRQRQAVDHSALVASA